MIVVTVTMNVRPRLYQSCTGARSFASSSSASIRQENHFNPGHHQRHRHDHICRHASFLSTTRSVESFLTTQQRKIKVNSIPTLGVDYDSRRYKSSIAVDMYPTTTSVNTSTPSRATESGTSASPSTSAGLPTRSLSTEEKEARDGKSKKSLGTSNAATSVLDIETIRAPLFDESSSTIPDVGPRPQTPMERMKNFPKGVLALFKDCLRYKHIHDASKTPRNAWTINQLNKRTHDSYIVIDESPQALSSPLSNTAPSITGCPDGDNKKTKPNTAVGTATTTASPSFFVYENEIRPGRIPRRQYEQQRRLKQDFRTMMPLVLVWIPPIIGFLPPLLAMLAPRQVMSSHFHSKYEILWYSSIEYSQRKQFYAPLGDMFWKSFPPGTDIHRSMMMLTETVEGKLSGGSRVATWSEDAGPIINAQMLYSTFCPSRKCQIHNQNNGRSKSQQHSMDRTTQSQLSHGVFTSVYDLPRSHLVRLALSIGIGQQFPLWLGRIIVHWTPSMLLRSQVNRLSEIVCHDDTLLLEEGHHCTHCQSLTDEEVSDACLLRGLPVNMDDHTADVRRQFLTDHLNMIADVKRSMDGPMDHDFRLFTMYLAPLRYHLMKTTKSTTSSTSSLSDPSNKEALAS